MPSTSHNHSSNSVLADLLCCSKCHKSFSNEACPLNLPCGHAVCLLCLSTGEKKSCSVDQITFTTVNVEDLPLNLPLLFLLNVKTEEHVLTKRSLKAYAYNHRLPDADLYESIERGLFLLASYFQDSSASSNLDCNDDGDTDGRLANADNNRDILSRALQRKLTTVLCAQPVVPESATQMFYSLRGIVERVLTELILILQNSSNLSSHLWSAVRTRGCQFLGPTMQEDVLRLILSALSNGELIARKALVMYIVQSLSHTYPNVSKTCVGHVVQLAYRASCFNVIKREGESSLMQLKEEFRNYQSLRHEHDSQIVQIALEAGLRISPEQWSSLLYGDLRHRAHMQTIVDRISSPQLLANAVSELRNLLNQKQFAGSNNERDPNGNIATLHHVFDYLKFLEVDDKDLKVDAKLLNSAIFDVNSILDTYVEFMKNRSPNRPFDKRTKKTDLRGTYNGYTNQHLYKTRLCRDVSSGKACPHGDNCTYAHGIDELRNGSKNAGRFGVGGGMLMTGGAFDPSSPTRAARLAPSGEFLSTAPVGPVTNPINKKNSILVDTAIAHQSAVALMASQSRLQAQTVAQPPPPAPPPLLANMVDGNMATLTPLVTADGIIPQVPPMVGAIDSVTGGIVGLIPVQNVANAAVTTTIEHGEDMPGSVMMEPIPLMPILVQGPPATFGGDNVMESQLQPPQLPQGPGPNILVPSPAQPVPIVPTAPAGSTLFPIPIGAIPTVPPGPGGLVMNSIQPVVGNSVTTAPTPGVVSGFIMGTQQNFWSNDSCAKNDSGDESFFSMLSSSLCKPAGRLVDNLNNVISPYNVENSFENVRRRSSGVTSSSGPDNKGDEEQLLMRRNEIISQLVDMRPSSKILEDFYDDDLENHVSYTVANSVLFDEKDSYFTNGGFDLPPLPIGSFKALDKKVDAPRLYNTLNSTLTSTTKTTVASTNYLRTACANSFPHNEPVALATVQSGCKNVIKDAIEQPLIASSLQNIYFSSHTGVDPLNSIQLVPTVIKPLPDRKISDPQNLVAHSLDRIIDVKEKINDVKKGGGVTSSAVEKEQLKVELGIAHRQITTLDEQTKESCLLKELKAVDKQIENLSMVV